MAHMNTLMKTDARVDVLCLVAGSSDVTDFKSLVFSDRLKPSAILSGENLVRVNMHYNDVKICREFGPSRF